MNKIELIQSLDVYIFSFFILMLIGFKSFKNANAKTPHSTVFSTLIFLIGCIILADCITLMFDEFPGKNFRILLISSTIAGFSLQILISLFWFWYVQMVVFPNKKLSRIEILLQSIPAFACIVISFMSYKSGGFFNFDDQNRYQRGSLFYIIIAGTLLYFAIGYYTIIKHRKELEKRYTRALLSFVIPPIAGGILQTLFYGVSLLWPSMTISVLIIYLAIQNELLLLDYITSLNNRRSFDQAITRHIQIATTDRSFGLFLIEITNMSCVQDKLGHAEGDRLLINFASQLKKHFHSAECIARYNDTIFAVIITLKNINDIYKIKESFKIEILKSKTKLVVNLGCAPYIVEEKTSLRTFLLQVEKLLCIDKLIPGDRRVSNCDSRR